MMYEIFQGGDYHSLVKNPNLPADIAEEIIAKNDIRYNMLLFHFNKNLTPARKIGVALQTIYGDKYDNDSLRFAVLLLRRWGTPQAFLEEQDLNDMNELSGIPQNVLWKAIQSIVSPHK